MRVYGILIGSVLTLGGLLDQASAGPLMRKMEMKQMEEQQAAQKSAASSPSSNQAQAQAQAKQSSADKAGSKFETSKTKCRELGNKEGTDKFNSCVMTLME